MKPLPLNALRVFESAARHLSFAKAAAELNVTPAAVSHQIKGLEARLGVALFRRLNRRLLLTDAAQLCLPGIRDGFQQLQTALGRVANPADANQLAVTSAPTFAARWLLPRLEKFRRAHPAIEFRLEASDRLVDLAHEPFDLAIRYGAGRYPGMRKDYLLSAHEFPVCSPKLLEGPHPLRKPEDLKHHTLIHYDFEDRPDSPLPNWRSWLLAARVKDVDPSKGPRLSPETMAIDAAIQGQGVALSAEALVSRDLAAGRLVKPFQVVLKLDFAYWLVSPKAKAEKPAVVIFRNWLLAESETDRAAERALYGPRPAETPNA